MKNLITLLLVVFAAGFYNAQLGSSAFENGYTVAYKKVKGESPKKIPVQADWVSSFDYGAVNAMEDPNAMLIQQRRVSQISWTKGMQQGERDAREELRSEIKTESK